MNEKEYVTIDGKKYELGSIMPGDVKPARVGWYMRNYGNWRSCRDYWDGQTWILGGDDGAMLHEATAQNLQWRGLAQPFEKQDAATSQDHPGPLGFEPKPIPDAGNFAAHVHKGDGEAGQTTAPYVPQPVEYHDPEGLSDDFSGLGKYEYTIGMIVAALLVALTVWASVSVGAWK
ncbi:hypothetical protein y223_00031 [Bordetella phage PY223]